MQDDKMLLLRETITENLRVQRDSNHIDYINVDTALQDACSRQNHAIFARRGCGKTLLLHSSARALKDSVKSIYLNCEDFKHHSFPNVLIEILRGIFRELDRNRSGWFGKRKRSAEIISGIVSKLDKMRQEADQIDEDIKTKSSERNLLAAGIEGGVDIEKFHLHLNAKEELQERSEIEVSFKRHTEKLKQLDLWLPELKVSIKDFFALSNKTESLILQLDDLYHLKRTDQAFVVDYIHRLCKDIPIYFKIATLRHASTLYVHRPDQPIGAQERHDYQPINIDYTFNDFPRTLKQNRAILNRFGEKAGLSTTEVLALFKGEGFERLIMAGGGVPRDVLSLFLEVLSDVASRDGKIGKDDVRILSRSNFERKIEELKQDSKGDEQDDLLKGIYIIRRFCLERETNLFLVKEQMLQQNDVWRTLFYRLLDYRIVHNCANALTHKSQQGTFQAFAIDIGCYAHLRKLDKKFSEIDVGAKDAKDKMRSAPILDEAKLADLSLKAPADVEAALLETDSALDD